MRKFILAWQELRGAGFGLERESAQGRLNQAIISLVLLLAVAIAEFSVVSFIIPTVPEAQPLLTPTLNLLATPTTTLAPLGPAVEATPADITPTPLDATPQAGGCIPGQVEITAPKDGDTISGGVEITWHGPTCPNFGFYKFEMKRPQDTNWLTILAGNEIKQGRHPGHMEHQPAARGRLPAQPGGGR